MQELQDKINELVAAKVAAGELDEMISKKLDATLAEVVDNLLGRWSDFSKNLTKSLGEAINVDLERLGLGRYNEAVAALVGERVDAAFEGNFAEQLKRSLDDTLRGAPAEVKLSEILAKLASDNEEEARQEEWEYATMLVKRSEYGSTWVYFDPKERGEDEGYNYAWSMLVDQDGMIGSVYSVEERHSRRTDRKMLFGDRRYGLERYLFHLYVGGTKIVMDLGPGVHTHDYPERYGD